jgi:DNA-binding NtrC family response regulator
MPARVVIVHNDTKFLASLTNRLIGSANDVATFSDPTAALSALDRARKVEVLITGVSLGGGQGLGLSLARVARAARPGVKVLFIARAGYQYLTKGVGEFMPAPADMDDVVTVVEQMLQSAED